MSERTNLDTKPGEKVESVCFSCAPAILTARAERDNRAHQLGLLQARYNKLARAAIAKGIDVAEVTKPGADIGPRWEMDDA